MSRLRFIIYLGNNILLYLLLFDLIFNSYIWISNCQNLTKTDILYYMGLILFFCSFPLYFKKFLLKIESQLRDRYLNFYRIYYDILVWVFLFIIEIIEFNIFSFIIMCFIIMGLELFNRGLTFDLLYKSSPKIKLNYFDYAIIIFIIIAHIVIVVILPSQFSLNICPILSWVIFICALITFGIALLLEPIEIKRIKSILI